MGYLEADGGGWIGWMTRFEGWRGGEGTADTEETGMGPPILWLRAEAVKEMNGDVDGADGVLHADLKCYLYCTGELGRRRYPCFSGVAPGGLGRLPLT
jgi:hypothetical protein